MLGVLLGHFLTEPRTHQLARIMADQEASTMLGLALCIGAERRNVVLKFAQQVPS